MSKPNPVTLTCSGCGISFQRPTWQYNQAVKKDIKTFYHNQECKIKYQTDTMVKASVDARAIDWKVRLERFIDRSPGLGPNGDCWEWTGALVVGYGTLTIKYRAYKSHRLMYELRHGLTLSKDIFIRHKCDNRKCVNPDHLEPGAHRDNMKDMVDRGRSAKGVGAHKAKLTENEVRVIRNLYAETNITYRRLGVIFDLDNSSIGDLINRKSWKHVL
jgi:hypothetical protein